MPADDVLVARFQQTPALHAAGERLYRGVARQTDSQVALLLTAVGMATLLLGAGVFSAIFLGPAALLWRGVLGIPFPGLPTRTAAPNELVTCTVNDATLAFRGERTHEDVSWRSCGQALESDDVFLLRYRISSWRVIPKAGFPSQGAVDRFRALAGKKVALRRVAGAA